MSEGYKLAKGAVNSGEVKRYIPLVRVSFHTEDKCYQTKGKVLEEDEALDPTYQVLSVSTQKQLDTPAGAFTVQLIGAEWQSRLKPNDLVVIQAGYKEVLQTSGEDTRGSEVLHVVMVGLIDTVRELRSAASPPTVQTTITGRDFGKVLIKSQLKFYPEVGAADTADASKFFLTDEGWITLMNTFTAESITKGTPAVVLDNIMRFLLPKLTSVEWTVWDEQKKTPVSKKVGLTHVLRYNFAKVDVFLPLIFTADQYEGSLWNLMERASIKPFTELFVDVRDASEAWNAQGKPRVVNETIEEASDASKAKFPKNDGFYPDVRIDFGHTGNGVVGVFMRNTPFDKKSWDQLYTHDVDAIDVLEEDLSISDNEHYNLFWAGTVINALGFDLKRVSPPLFNEKDALRYGMSPLEVTVEGLSIEQDNPEAPTLLEGMSKAFTQKLKDWYEKNHEMMTGTIRTRGRGNFRIGHRLLREGIGRMFYIEGVTQTFNVFESWETTLNVTRGEKLARKTTAASPTTTKKAAAQKPVSKKTDDEIKAKYYTVKSGDSLWSIAAKAEVYGNGDLWTRLWDANKVTLIQRDARNETKPGQYLYAGQVLQIP